MSLWVCQECTTRYSVDAPQCPHCGATGYLTLAEQEVKDGEEDEMPKNTVHTGASIEGPDGVTEMVGAPTIGVPRVGEAESTTDEQPVDDTVVTDPLPDEPVSVDNPDPDGSGGTHTSEVAAPTAPKTSRRK